jgi:hypothetical protein
MDFSNNNCWTITSIASTTVYRGDVAATLPTAWLAALAAGRAALLSGDLATLAISVNGQLEALLDPGRDAAGELDPAAVTDDLLEIYQSATGDEIIERLVAGVLPLSLHPVCAAPRTYRSYREHGCGQLGLAP